MGTITHFFGEADLRCQHHGLSEMAKKENIDVGKLQPGEYVVFVNHARDRIKLYTTSNIIAYLKLDRGKIDLRTIEHIPKAFEGSGRIDYDTSLKAFVESSLVKKGKTGPLEAAREIEKLEKALLKVRIPDEDHPFKKRQHSKKVSEEEIPIPENIEFSLTAAEESKPKKRILRKTTER